MKGYIFTCTNKTEKECFERMIFGTNKLYGDNVLCLEKNDTLFLYNMDSDTLYGIFKAKGNGKKDIIPTAWKGAYPYQIEIERDGEIKAIKGIKKIFQKTGIDRKGLLNEYQIQILIDYLHDPDNFDFSRYKNKLVGMQITDEKPPIESTTLWDYPKQSYGKTPKGDNKYAGVTPAFIIYNMIKRYTEPGDLVVDPMAGSGTTIDVCKEENRRCIAYDIAPPRPDVIQNDARNIPLNDDSVDMIFIDSPYGDNIKYNDHPDNIGNISAEDERFYDELEKVMKECFRILKPGKVLGWLIGDQWVKKRFTPVGFKVYERLCKYFEPIDIICVARRNQTSNTGIWHNRAIRFNFYLRGFKYLLLMKKPQEKELKNLTRKTEWTQYRRRGKD
ncbi:MAG: DNA methyltransferase [Syntrophorhabdaceae bacterium]|nr:DNA methyltransferase [Syntrophorhabdaceae bacterium]